MSAPFNYVRPPELIRRSLREDRYEKRVNNWIVPWDGSETFDVGLLMVPFGKAAQSGTSGAAAGPNAIRQAFLTNTTYSPDFDVDLQPLRVRDLGDVLLHMTDILRCHSNMKEAVVEVYRKAGDILLVVVGGDHSITCPVVEGYCLAHPEERVGIIHFDAHNDVRNFEDGGPTNGTPFRGILEGPSHVEGRNLVQLGIHGFMNSSYYKKYCEDHRVTIVSAREIRRQGIGSVMEKAVRIASEGTDSIYVSVDIDVLSLPYAFGTGAASPEGVEVWDLLEAMFLLGQHPNVRALDLVCIDPLRDFRDYTSRTGASIILTFLGGHLIEKTGGRGY